MHSILLFSLLAATALAAPTPDASPLKVTLPKRTAMTLANGALDLKTYLGQMNRVIEKYSGVSLKSYDTSSLAKRATGKEPLKDQANDVLYYGAGMVGGKSGFTFDFDTGSSDLFVPGPTCGTAQGCVAGTQYQNTGTDEGNTTMVTYGSGQVSGENFIDTVTVAGLTANKQNVVSLTQAAGFSTSASNSLMGMAFSTIANSKMPTYFENLMAQGTVTANEFAFFLGRLADNTGMNSELFLGGRNTAHYTGALTTVPVSSRTYWQIALDNVEVNGVGIVGKVVSLLGTLLGTVTKGQAAIDTGTTIILAPTVAATAVYAQIPGSIPVPLELIDGSLQPILFIYPCSSKPNVAITFGGNDLAIDNRDFNFGQLTPDYATILGNNTLATFLNQHASYCVGAIAAFDIQPTENLYVVGDTFIKNWYSIFSYDAANGQPAVIFGKSKA